MLKYNMALLIGSATLFTAAIAMASIETDGAPPRDENRTYTRKSGDMVIFYNGRGYRSLSTRRGSLHNRSYRGGGLRGGK